MTYRIKQDGDYYFPQKRKWLFWRYFYFPDDERTVKWFTSLRDARAFLERDELFAYVAKTWCKHNPNNPRYHKFP